MGIKSISKRARKVVSRSVTKKRLPREQGDSSLLESLPVEILERIVELALSDTREDPEDRVHAIRQLASVSRTFRKAALDIDRDAFKVISTQTCQYRSALGTNFRPKRFVFVCTVIDLKTWHGRRTLEMPDGILFSEYMQIPLPDLQDVTSLYLKVRGFSGKRSALGEMEDWAAKVVFLKIIERVSQWGKLEELALGIDGLETHDLPLRQCLRHCRSLRKLELVLKSVSPAYMPLDIGWREPANLDEEGDLPFSLQSLYCEGHFFPVHFNKLLPNKILLTQTYSTHPMMSTQQILAPLLEEFCSVRLQLDLILPNPRTLFASMPNLRVLRIGRLVHAEHLPILIQNMPRGVRFEVMQMDPSHMSLYEAECAEHGVDLRWIPITMPSAVCHQALYRRLPLPYHDQLDWQSGRPLSQTDELFLRWHRLAAEYAMDYDRRESVRILRGLI